MAYVTSDFDRALQLFADEYDVPEFGQLGEVELPLDDGGQATIKIGLAFVGTLQLEIIEPRGGRDDIYRRALPAEGFGLVWHHVGFKAPSLETLEEARSELTGSGYSIALSGGKPDASMFFYADARATLGHYLEYIYLTPEREEFHRQMPHH